MQSRMKNPAMLLPKTMQALQAVADSIKDSGVPETMLELIHLRVSQINGCSVCVDMHSRMLKRQGETDERLFAIGAWRDAPYFSEAERAALDLAEAVTRIADRPDPVPDSIYNEAARHFGERALAALIVAISNINVWNRLNIATKQVAGEWIKSAEAQKWLEERHAIPQ